MGTEALLSIYRRKTNIKRMLIQDIQMRHSLGRGVSLKCSKFPPEAMAGHAEEAGCDSRTMRKNIPPFCGSNELADQRVCLCRFSTIWRLSGGIPYLLSAFQGMMPSKQY